MVPSRSPNRFRPRASASRRCARAIAAALLLGSAAASGEPKVGTWLHPDLSLDEWLCGNEIGRPTQLPHYVHSKIQPSSWRQTLAHSDVVALNNFVFAESLPWSVFTTDRSYAEYLAEFQAFDPVTEPEGRWFARVDQHLRAALLDASRPDDPIAAKTIYLYAHLFGYDAAQAEAFGLAELFCFTYAWPPKGLDGGWPPELLYDDDAGGPKPPRPSLKPLSARRALANAAYFLVKHFEGVGAKVAFSPWREINAYKANDPVPCSNCGVDTWADLFAVYDAMLGRIEGEVDPSKISVFPTVQLESFLGAGLPCVPSMMVDIVKRFYELNAAHGIPFEIGLSAYPKADPGGIRMHQRRLMHLLDGLNSPDHVACDVNDDGTIAPGEGTDESHIHTSVTVPKTTQLFYGETSRPDWFHPQGAFDAETFRREGRLSIALANTLLEYEYRAADDGAPAYPLDGVVFVAGASWQLPSWILADGKIELCPDPDVPKPGAFRWATFSAGVSGGWLTSMQPRPAALLLDATLDPDNDWDNDGVKSLVVGRNPFAHREPRRGLDDILYKVVPRDFSGNAGSLRVPATDEDDIAYVQDDCPYAPNADQLDTDGDGVGDVCDNCKRVPNYPQEDWDQDGFGNVCDPDLDGNGNVQAEVDLAVIQQCQGAAIDCLATVQFPNLPPGQTAPDLNGKVVLIADLDADEDVDAADVGAWHALVANPVLRESGFACAGTAPCPDPRQVMLRTGIVATIEDPPPAARTCSP